MSYIELISVAFVLAIDAMTVSVTNGIRLRSCSIKNALMMALFFGGFQFIMPIIGFLLGEGVASFVGDMAPYLAFGILSFLGINMIIESRKAKEEDAGDCKEKLGAGELTLQAVATSIDALAVGLSFSILPNGGGMIFSSSVIGIVAFACSLTGALAGKKLGKLFEKRAELIGGIILIAVGIKMLVESFIPA